MDQQGAQAAIAMFTDAEQAITAATGPLLGYQPEPGGGLATILEALPITPNRNCDASESLSEADSRIGAS
jgi:hypothetical protein